MKIKEILKLVDSLLAEGYKEAQTDFADEADDVDLVSKKIDSYKDLVQRNQVKGNERNIDYWRKQGWDKFNARVSELESETSKTQMKRKTASGRAINLIDNDEWLIVIPLDKNASCFHGRKSDWCTTKPFQSNFEHYFYDNDIMLIYCLNQQDGKMWAIAAHKDLTELELFTQDNTSINKSTFNSQTGLNVDDIVAKAFKDQKITGAVEDARVKYRAAVKEATDLIDDDSTDYKKIEKLIRFTKNGKLAVKYVKYREV